MLLWVNENLVLDLWEGHLGSALNSAAKLPNEKLFVALGLEADLCLNSKIPRNNTWKATLLIEPEVHLTFWLCYLGNLNESHQRKEKEN